MISIVVAALVAATPISLEEVRAAARHATSAQLSELERLRAQEQVNIARSGVLPQVSLNVGGGYTADSRHEVFVPRRDAEGNVILEIGEEERTPQGGLSLSASVRQLLFDAPTWANLSVAHAQFDAATAQAVEDRLTAELEGIRRYYDLVRAQRSQEVFASRVRSSEELAERAEALFQAGRRRKEDAISARINLGNDRSALARQHAVVTQASALLASYIGRPPSEPLTAQEDPTQAALPVVPAFDAAIKQARETRPQLQALEALGAAAREAVGGASGAYLPSADVALTYQRNSGPTLGSFFNPLLQHQGGVRFGVQWDIFNGFRTNAQVGQAKVAERRALLQLEQAKRDVEADLTSRLDALSVQLELTKIAEENLKLANDNLSLAEARFQEGAGSTLEIRDAQNKRDQAALDVITSKIDLELARAGVERAIGAFGPGAAP